MPLHYLLICKTLSRLIAMYTVRLASEGRFNSMHVSFKKYSGSDKYLRLL